MQQGRYPSLLDQRVGRPLEHFGIERLADGLRLRHGRAHCLGPLLELDTNALAVHRFLVAVPGEAFHADLRNIAAEATVAVQQRSSRTSPGGRQSTGTAADYQDIRFQDDIDRPGRLIDSLHELETSTVKLQSRSCGTT